MFRVFSPKNVTMCGQLRLLPHAAATSMRGARVPWNPDIWGIFHPKCDHVRAAAPAPARRGHVHARCVPASGLAK